MSAEQTFSYILSDDQMRAQLESAATIRFEGLEIGGFLLALKRGSDL